MKILRRFLSIVAFVIVLVGTGEATTFLHIGPSLVAFILSGGNLLGMLGISPIKIGLATARVFTALSSFILLGMGSFAAFSAGHPTWAPAHLLLVHLVHAVGAAGVLLGIAGGVPSLAAGLPPAPPEPPVPPAPAAA